MGNCKAQEQLGYFNLVGTIDTDLLLVCILTVWHARTTKYLQVSGDIQRAS